MAPTLLPLALGPLLATGGAEGCSDDYKEVPMFVFNHMTSDPLSVTAGAKLRRVAELMRVHDVGHVPVTDELRHPVGLINDREIRLAAERYPSRWLDLPAHRIMSYEFASVTLHTTLGCALTLIHNKGAGALLVLDDVQLVGIITRRAFFLALYRMLGLVEEGLRIERTLVDPCDDFARAIDVLRRGKPALRSVVTSRFRDDGDEPASQLRTGSCKLRQTESALLPGSLTFLEPEED